MQIVNILRDITRQLPQLDTDRTKAFIVGGAPRDVDHGLMPKDIDIFFDFSPGTTNTPQGIKGFLEQGFPQLAPYTFRDLTGNTDYDENLTQIEAVYEWKWFEGRESIPVQAIFRRSQEIKSSSVTFYNILETFDLDICQIGLMKNAAGTIDVKKGEHYSRAKDNRSVFNLNDNTPLTTAQQAKTRERATRIGEKLGYTTAGVQFLHPPTDQAEVEAERQAAAARYQEAQTAMYQRMYENVRNQNAQANQYAQYWNQVTNQDPLGMNNTFGRLFG